MEPLRSPLFRPNTILKSHTQKQKQTFELGDELDSFTGFFKSRQAKNRSQNPIFNALSRTIKTYKQTLPYFYLDLLVQLQMMSQKNPISTGATKRTITKCSFPLMNNEWINL